MPNSWQSPVAGEPSLGMPHPHYAEVVTNADPADTNWVTVDISGQVPVGATMIYVWAQCVSTAINHDLQIQTTSTTPTISPIVLRTQVANVAVMGTGLVQLTASRTFVYKATNAAISAVYIRMFFYWS